MIMDDHNTSPDPAPPPKEQFAVKDCALVALATDCNALTLREFCNHLRTVDEGSIYHHFWGGLLHPRFEEREFNNDFAAWVRHGVHDYVLAERLALVDPTRFTDLETLRMHLLDMVESRLDESESLSWSRATQPFHFISSQIVVFDTNKRLYHPRELALLLPGLSTSSLFYHFIDARRRTDTAIDDFSLWLQGLDQEYQSLIQQLADVDPYFGTLTSLRQQLADIFQAQFPTTAHAEAMT